MTTPIQKLLIEVAQRKDTMTRITKAFLRMVSQKRGLLLSLHWEGKG